MYRHFPRFGERSILAALASECAADQDAFWPYHEILFAERAASRISRDVALDIAARIDLDTDAFAACYDDQRHLNRVAFDFQQGRDAGVFGTPTIWINGEQAGGINEDLLFDAIRTALDG